MHCINHTESDEQIISDDTRNMLSIEDKSQLSFILNGVQNFSPVNLKPIVNAKLRTMAEI